MHKTMTKTALEKRLAEGVKAFDGFDLRQSAPEGMEARDVALLCDDGDRAYTHVHTGSTAPLHEWADDFLGSDPDEWGGTEFIADHALHGPCLQPAQG